MFTEEELIEAMKKWDKFPFSFNKNYLYREIRVPMHHEYANFELQIEILPTDVRSNSKVAEALPGTTSNPKQCVTQQLTCNQPKVGKDSTK